MELRFLSKNETDTFKTMAVLIYPDRLQGLALPGSVGHRSTLATGLDVPYTSAKTYSKLARQAFKNE